MFSPAYSVKARKVIRDGLASANLPPDRRERYRVVPTTEVVGMDVQLRTGEPDRAGIHRFLHQLLHGRERALHIGRAEAVEAAEEPQVLARGQLGREDFDDDRAAELGVRRFINCSLAACANFLCDFEAAERLADHRGGI